jgi:hypothetical protein
MDTCLFKCAKACWVVASIHHEEAQVFHTIEEASSYLERVGVPDESIDAALISMAVRGTTRAAFHPDHGAYMFSDFLNWNDLIGVA